MASLCSQLTILVFVLFLLTSHIHVAAIATFLAPFTLLVLPLVIFQIFLLFGSFLWPSLLASALLAFALTIGLLRYAHALRQYALILLCLLILPPFVILSDIASQRAMCSSARAMGADTIHRYNVAHNIRNSGFMDFQFSSWNYTPHATLRTDTQTYHWSYRKLAWYPARLHVDLPGHTVHTCTP